MNAEVVTEYTIYFGMLAPFHSTIEQTLRDAMLRIVTFIERDERIDQKLR